MSNVTGKAVKYGNIYYATIHDFPIQTVQTNILYHDFLVTENIVVAQKESK